MNLVHLPQEERAREQAVKNLRLLDTAPEERFDRVCRLAQRMFGTQMAGISLLDGQREWYKSAVALPAREIPRADSFLNVALESSDVTVVPDASADARFASHPQVTGEAGLRFYVACPVCVKGGIKVGALSLMSRSPRPFDDDDRALLRDLARLVENELSGTRLDNMDALTLLSNRRGLEELSQHALNICRRFARPATLLHFDVEAMDQINRRFGRHEGDLALKNLGRIMIHTFRASDVVARLGEDQFAVLMSDTTEENAAPALTRLFAALNEYNLTARRGYNLSYSVGTLQYRAEAHPSITGLLGAADMAMSERKRKKRQQARSQQPPQS
jgi:diguanylate cyclase (GGDEF)-like protein